MRFSSFIPSPLYAFGSSQREFRCYCLHQKKEAVSRINIHIHETEVFSDI